MASRSRRAAGSANTTERSVGRSIPPPLLTTPGPNRSATAATAAPSGARISWAMRSASRITAPRASRRLATVDFPEPIPPDRPMRITGETVLPLEVPLHVLEDRLQRLGGLWRDRRRKQLPL